MEELENLVLSSKVPIGEKSYIQLKSCMLKGYNVLNYIAKDSYGNNLMNNCQILELCRLIKEDLENKELKKEYLQEVCKVVNNECKYSGKQMVLFRYYLRKGIPLKQLKDDLNNMNQSQYYKLINEMKGKVRIS